MTKRSEVFRQKAEQSLGLAVSVFTLASEDEGFEDRFPLVRELIFEHGDDPRIAGNALSFVCHLLSRYMTPEEVRKAKDRLIEKTIGEGRG